MTTSPISAAAASADAGRPRQECGPPLSAEPPAAAARFVEEFREAHGRPPRILHVGNIANNAYLNAKFLNHAGFDCDVLCYDYYHLMGCPEWEDADFEGDIADQFRPDWTAVDLRGFNRPKWFAQGPQSLCIEYLTAKRSGQLKYAELLWRELGRLNKTRKPGYSISPLLRFRDLLTQLRWRLRLTISRVRGRSDAHALLWSKLDVWASRRGAWGWLVAALAAPLLLAGVSTIQIVGIALDPLPFNRMWSRLERRALDNGSYVTSALVAVVLMPIVMVIRIVAAALGLTHDAATVESDRMTEWRELFTQVFPERADVLTEADLLPYQGVLPVWKRLLSHYDIVQAYATDVVYPLLTRKRPFIGFEHGTLRDFTLADNSISRLTALAYQQADHVFITNGDCLGYAHRINITSYSPMVHPVDDERIRTVRADYEGCHRAFNAKYLFVCPLRHDWTVKGTDKYIRALPEIVARIGRDVRVVMTRWGAQLDDSRALAVSLGVDKYIAWVEPLPRTKLVRLQKSADIVFDQIALPHFGATAPQAIAAGVPVIMSYDPASTAWIIPEPAPILSAWTSDDIVRGVETGLDPQWRADYSRRAAQWFDTYHSSKQAVARASETYRDVCLRNGILRGTHNGNR